MTIPRDTYDWAVGRLQDGELTFESDDGFERALSDGFFFVLAPESLLLDAGDCFASNFYLDRRGDSCDAYRGFKTWTTASLDKRQGYFCRDADQVEQFFLESRFWKRVFPLALVRQAVEMRDFSIEVIRSILHRLDLPLETLDKATGGILSGRGTYHLTFNHFRPHVRARGLNVHKDSGWLTMLRSTSPGLEVRRGNTWAPVVPRPGAFVVNFGCAVEILTQYTRRPVSAVAHRVAEQQTQAGGLADRFSYGLFVDSSLDPEQCAGLYRLDPVSGLVLANDFDAFLNEILLKTYDPDAEGLY